MPENTELTLQSIRKKTKKTEENYTLDEILATWAYLENPADNDTALEGLTNKEREQTLSSRRQDIKNIDESRLTELMEADLSRLNAEELDTLKRYLNYVSLPSLNEKLLSRIDVREQELNDAEALSNIAPEITQPEAEAPEDQTAEDEAEVPEEPVENQAVDNGGAVVFGSDQTEEDVDENAEDSEESEDDEYEYDEYETLEDSLENDPAFLDYYGISNIDESSKKTVEENVTTIFRNSEDENETHSLRGYLLASEHPDFDKAWDKIEIVKDGKSLTPEQKEEEKQLFLEQVFNETAVSVANNKSLLQTDFRDEFSDRLQLNLVQLASAQAVAWNTPKEALAEQFGRLFNKDSQSGEDTQSGENTPNKVEINHDTLIGWHAGKQTLIEKARDILAKRSGANLSSLSQSISRLDARLTEKYGKKYEIAKKTARTAAWGGLYGLAGSTLGPLGIASVATISTWMQFSSLHKEYKAEKEKVEAQNRILNQAKKFTFKDYWKQNKFAVTSRMVGIVLSTSTMIAGVGNFQGFYFSLTKGVVGAGLGLGGILKNTGEAYQAAPKGKKLWHATKALAFSSAAFVLAYLAGQKSGELASGVFSHDVPVTTETNTSGTDNTQPNGSVAPTTPSDETDVNDKAPAGENTAGSNDGASTGDADTTSGNQETDNTSTIDPDNLTPEQQHDLKMLFGRAPAEANEILGNSGEDWMNSRQLQEAWDRGDLTLEQKQALVDFAGERFDEHGHFRNVEGRTSADVMESTAKAAHTASHSGATGGGSHFPSQEEALAADQSRQTPVSEPQEQTGTVSEPQEQTAQPKEQTPKTDTTEKTEGKAEEQKPQTQEVQTPAHNTQRTTFIDKDGNVSCSMTTSTGTTTHITANSEGKVLSMTSTHADGTTHTATPEQLDNMNSKPENVANMKTCYQSTVRAEYLKNSMQKSL